MKKKIIIVFLVIALLGIVNSGYYIVREDEVAVLQTFGKITAVVVDAEDVEKVEKNLESSNYDVQISRQKGLHFKIPFIQKVQRYTGKYLTYLSDEELINTNDGRRIQIQTYAQYRVADPVTFTVAVQGDVRTANKRMDEYVYKTVINTANQLGFNEFFYKETLENLLNEKLEILNETLIADFGIFVSDIGINRKTFPEKNIVTIEEKMSKEIEKESQKLTAEGDSEYLQAKAQTDRQQAEIVSKAVEEAAKIKAEADAEALRIYQSSLKKDLEFYRFIKRMEIYRNMKETTIFLDGDSDLFKYLEGY